MKRGEVDLMIGLRSDLAVVVEVVVVSCRKDWRVGGGRRDERGRRALGQPSRVEWAKGKGGATTARLEDKDVATKCVWPLLLYRL